MRFLPQISFKGVARDTHKKINLDDVEDDVHKEWKRLFREIVVSYFDDRDIPRFHREFDPVRDKLDCRVPSLGNFACGGDEAIIGRRIRKKQKPPLEPEPSPKGSCGHKWNSGICLTKFVCSIEKPTQDQDKTMQILAVEVREYGQRCDRCKNRYENATFTDRVLKIMIQWMLMMLVEGMFGIFDEDIQFNPEDIGQGYNPRRGGYNRKNTHFSKWCQACTEGKGCAKGRKIIKPN